MRKTYYANEPEYPFWTHYIDEKGQDKRLVDEEIDPADVFIERPDTVQVSWPEYQRKLRHAAQERAKLLAWKEWAV